MRKTMIVIGITILIYTSLNGILNLNYWGSLLILIVAICVAKFIGKSITKILKK